MKLTIQSASFAKGCAAATHADVVAWLPAGRPGGSGARERRAVAAPPAVWPVRAVQPAVEPAAKVGGSGRLGSQVSAAQSVPLIFSDFSLFSFTSQKYFSIVFSIFFSSFQ